MAEAEAVPAVKTIKLRSQDDQVFEVDEEVAFKSGTVKTMVEDVETDVADQMIPLASVKSDTLAKVIEFCKYHLAAAKKKKEAGGDDDEDDDEDDDDDDFDFDSEKPKEKDDEASKWNKEFVKDMEQPALFDLILAANYLDVKDLLDFLIQHVANMIIECKDPAEVRAKFNIPDDLTPEEVEDIKRKNTWAFE